MIRTHIFADVIFTVNATDDAEMARKLTALRNLAEQPFPALVDAGPRPPADPAHPEVPPDDVQPPEEMPDAVSYMRVTEAEGKAGEFVTVDLVGGTHAPTAGFMFAVGFGRRLVYDGYKIGEFIKSLTPDVYTKVVVHTDGHPEPFVQIGHFFFRIAPAGDPSLPRGVSEPQHYLIPQDTVLLSLRFRIPPGMAPMTQRLVNRSGWFRHNKDAPLAVTSLYTSNLEPHRMGGIKPALYDGFVRVVS